MAVTHFNDLRLEYRRLIEMVIFVDEVNRLRGFSPERYTKYPELDNLVPINHRVNRMRIDYADELTKPVEEREHLIVGFSATTMPFTEERLLEKCIEYQSKPVYDINAKPVDVKALVGLLSELPYLEKVHAPSQSRRR